MKREHEATAVMEAVGKCQEEITDAFKRQQAQVCDVRKKEEAEIHEEVEIRNQAVKDKIS